MTTKRATAAKPRTDNAPYWMTAPRVNAEIFAAHRWHTPFNGITLYAGLRDGKSFMSYNGWFEDKGLTLIEYPATNRLRIIFAGVRDGWIEVALSDFRHLLELAREEHGPTFDIFTTVVVGPEPAPLPPAPPPPATL